jgi:hypothetical protein
MVGCCADQKSQVTFELLVKVSTHIVLGMLYPTEVDSDAEGGNYSVFCPLTSDF